MPLFYKQGDSPGVWKNVETPFMKQQGDWVEPEQVYIKEGGSWKLIFEKFTFVVETLDPGYTETSQETILEGRLNDFENDFEAEDSFFFDQKLEQPGYVNATAVDEDRKLIAVGGGDGQVYVFDSQLRINRVSSAPTPSRIDNLDTITQPAGEIEGLDFYRSEDVLAVAADNLYVYDENFSDINVFSTDEGNGYTDVEFNESTGQIAASTPGGYVYVYQFDNPGWSQTQKVNFTGDGLSVSWRESDSYFAVGTSAGTVEVYNDAFNSTNTLSNHAGNVKVEFNGSGTLATVDENEVKVYSGDPLTLDETFLDSTEGLEGDVDWSGDGFLVHASTDKRIYVYDSSAAYELVKSFNNASRTFKSVSWDSENHQIVAGTAQNGSGEAFVYSTGARMFFDWGEFGSDYEYRQRASGLRATGDPGGNFQIGLDGLDVNTQYEFRAGGFAAGGRVVIDVERDSNNNIIKKDTFTTADISVVTQGPTDTTSSSTTFVGTVDTFDKSGNIDVSFEWGEQGNGLPNELDAGLVSGTVQFQENVDGLAPGQTYEYRAKAKFGGVTVRGSINTVTIYNVTANMVSSDPVDFGTAFEESEQDQGSTSSRNITIEESSGSGDGYNIENTSITGPDSNEFTVVSVPSSSTSPDVPSGTQKNIDVRFEAINDGARTATIEIEHDAPLGNDPLQVGLEGVAEKAVNLEVPGTTFTTTADQNEETKTFNINETGGDYDATITSIEEANSQPANHEASEWRIVNRPGNLDGGGNATVPAGGTVTFEVGWNPDTGDAQDYDIVINYQGQGVPDSETEEITINGTVSGIVNIAVDPERDGNTSRGVTDGSFTYTYTDRLDPDTLEDVVPFSIVGDKDGDYTVNEISISGTDSEDFFIQNAPASTTDADSSTGQLVNITDPGEMRFDVVFSPATSDTPGQSEWNANLDIEADNANNNTHSINLVGLQPSEITTSASSLSFGPTIHGGNLSSVNGVDERTTQTVTISNASSDRTFDVTDDAIVSDDFEFFASGGGSAGTGTIDGGDSTTDLTAEIEFAPEPSEDYTDTTTVNGTYKISHDAEFGSNPTTVSLDGTVQVTALNYETEGNSFDPILSTPDIIIAGNPNDADFETKTFTIESDIGNDVATEVFITSPSPDNISTILNLNQEKSSILAPGESITGQMNYDPSSSEDDGEIERVQVEWDNFSHDESIVVKGVIGSTINVETQDGSPNNATLAFTTTENTTDTLDIVAFEVGGSESYNLTSSSLVDSQSGRYSVNNDFDGSSGDNTIDETVSAGGSKTASIDFSPAAGEAGSGPYIGQFDFTHDAQFETDGFETSPVSISLEGTVLTRPSVSLYEEVSGDTVANYEIIEGNSTSTTTAGGGIVISETVNNGQVVIQAFDVINDTDSVFSMNNSESTVDTSRGDNVSGGSFTISSGGSQTAGYVMFSPPLDTSKTNGPDTSTADFQVTWTAEGYDTTQTSTISVSGDALEPATAKIETGVSFGRWANIAGIDENTGGYTGGTGYDALETVTIQEVYGNEGYILNSVDYTGPGISESYSLFNFPDKSSYDFNAGESITRDVEYQHPNNTSDPGDPAGLVGSSSGEYSIDTNATKTENGSLQVETNVTSLTAISKVADQTDVYITYEWNITWNISGFGSSNKDGEFYNGEGGEQTFNVFSENPNDPGITITQRYTKETNSRSVDVRFDIYDSIRSNPIARAYDSVDVPEIGIFL